MTIKVHGLLHVAMVTEDIDRLTAFYTGLLGAEETKRLELTSHRFAEGVGVPGARATTVHLRIPGAQTVLELTEYERSVRPDTASAPSNATGLRHLALAVSDIAAATAELRDRRVEIVGGPVEVDAPAEARGVRFLYFRDPDGNLVELIQPPAAPTA
ncbi:VOC family protein [Streptomyces sp. SM11]|uniref:VOC family protein n=1 Tax=Streptomyces sp. SM11 TaxID=565557 RepID=UPI000CD54672|nr:VOC family protein [Streptomyces sp. SM11]